MTDDPRDIEEHELPTFEAVIAASMALMTAYSQALQAELHPHHRLAMGRKIVAHLNLLRQQPGLSTGFGEVLRTLQRCWQTMHGCTQEAARSGAGVGAADGCGFDCDCDCDCDCEGDCKGESAHHPVTAGDAMADEADRQQLNHRGDAGRHGGPRRLH